MAVQLSSVDASAQAVIVYLRDVRHVIPFRVVAIAAQTLRSYLLASMPQDAEPIFYAERQRVAAQKAEARVTELELELANLRARTP